MRAARLATTKIPKPGTRILAPFLRFLARLSNSASTTSVICFFGSSCFSARSAEICFSEMTACLASAMWFFLCQCNAALRRAKRYAPENRIWQRFFAGRRRVVSILPRLTEPTGAACASLADAGGEVEKTIPNPPPRQPARALLEHYPAVARVDDRVGPLAAPHRLGGIQIPIALQIGDVGVSIGHQLLTYVAAAENRRKRLEPGRFASGPRVLLGQRAADSGG